MPSGKPLSASFALHCLILLLLIYARQVIPADAAAQEPATPSYEKIYYPLPAMNAAKPMPRIAPAGAGARPGDGAIRELLPALGSTTRQGDLMAFRILCTLTTSDRRFISARRRPTFTLQQIRICQTSS